MNWGESIWKRRGGDQRTYDLMPKSQSSTFFKGGLQFQQSQDLPETCRGRDSISSEIAARRTKD
jgi:hypothetical protein